VNEATEEAIRKSKYTAVAKLHPHTSTRRKLTITGVCRPYDGRLTLIGSDSIADLKFS